METRNQGDNRKSIKLVVGDEVKTVCFEVCENHDVDISVCGCGSRKRTKKKTKYLGKVRSSKKMKKFGFLGF